MDQITDTVLMISPSQFGFNDQTAESNSFQQKGFGLAVEEIQKLALSEFKAFVKQLKQNGIEVIEYQDQIPCLSPDSIFPNNWFSTHSDGKLISYPMFAENRRRERRKDILHDLIKDYDFEHISLEHLENGKPPQILEGTGSMVLDRVNKIAFAVNSSRTSISALKTFGEAASYKTISFDAYASDGKPIYHTNVLMSIGENFVAIGLENIDPKQKSQIIDSLKNLKKEIIELSPFQINHCFAGNILQLKNKDGDRLLIISQSAYSSLSPMQLHQFQKHHDRIIGISIPSIELYGGGSVRCMMAEIFQKKTS